MKLWANLDISLSLARAGEAAQRAEQLGFDCISAPDVMYDGLLLAAMAAAGTQKIDIATSALVCFPRSPMTVAVAAWNLQEFSAGRFRLGLGPLIAQNIIQKYSTPWHPPAPRMREYVNALRAIFSRWQLGTPLDFHGEYYQFTRQQDFTAPAPLDHPEMPLHLAAIGPNMCALAGEIADALFAHPTNTSPRYIREHILPAVARGALRSGRDPNETGIIACPFVATGRSTVSIESQWERHRATLATVFSTPNYWPSLEMFGFDDLGPKLRAMTREGQWQRMTNEFPDDIAQQFIYRGDYAQVGEQLSTAYRGIASGIALQLPIDRADDQQLADLVAKLKHTPTLYQRA